MASFRAGLHSICLAPNQARECRPGTKRATLHVPDTPAGVSGVLFARSAFLVCASAIRTFLLFACWPNDNNMRVYAGTNPVGGTAGNLAIFWTNDHATPVQACGPGVGRGRGCEGKKQGCERELHGQIQRLRDCSTKAVGLTPAKRG